MKRLALGVLLLVVFAVLVAQPVNATYLRQTWGSPLSYEKKEAYGSERKLEAGNYYETRWEFRLDAKLYDEDSVVEDVMEHARGEASKMGANPRYLEVIVYDKQCFGYPLPTDCVYRGEVLMQIHVPKVAVAILAGFTLITFLKALAAVLVAIAPIVLYAYAGEAIFRVLNIIEGGGPGSGSITLIVVVLGIAALFILLRRRR